MAWNVDDAVKEVLAAIAEGSKLPFSDAELATYRGLYTPSFQKQHDKGVDWNTDKKGILPQAVLVGALAAAITFAKVAAKNSDQPTQVDAESAFEAASMVASAGYCEHPDPNHGKYCANLAIKPASAIAAGPEVIEHFSAALRLLRPS